MNELALFAGAGGGILGGALLGWRTVCAVEHNAYAASVLAARQNDGLLPPFPVWDDVRTFDGRPWRGIVDVVSGGFPCQDISVAGKGAGIDGERSGLWGEMVRIIGEVRPRFAFVENSPALVTRGLGRVLSDLAALGYDCRWTVLGAADVGAPHQRDRFWLVAHAMRDGHQQQEAERFNPRQCAGLAEAHSAERDEISDALVTGRTDVADPNGLRELQPHGCQCDERRRACNSREGMAHPDSERRQEQHASSFSDNARQHPGRPAAGRRTVWWATEPDVGRVADGVAARVDRLAALGNGQVPLVAATAWRALT